MKIEATAKKNKSMHLKLQGKAAVTKECSEVPLECEVFILFTAYLTIFIINLHLKHAVCSDLSHSF